MKRFIFSFIFTILLSGSYLSAQLFSDNFDNDTPGTTPAGWTSYTTQSDDPGFIVVNDSALALSLGQFMAHLGEDISQVSESWIVSPPIQLTGNQEMIFYWRMKWSFAYDYSGVYISTGSNDPIAHPQDFEELEEFDPDSHPTWNEWNKVMYDLRPYGNQTVYIAFKYRGDFAHDFYVDDFVVQDIPYCNPPLSFELDVDRRTDSSLTVTWENPPGAEDFQIVWGPVDFDPDSATPTDVSGVVEYTIQGLEPGTWYEIYIRTKCRPYHFSSWAGPVRGRTIGPPPANDRCDGAEELRVTASCAPVVGTNFDATDSGVPDPGCAGYEGGDVWYKIGVPSNGNLIVETSPDSGSDINDTGLAVYEGTCGNLTLIECDDDGGEGLFSKILLTGLTPGDTIYARVWEYGNNSFGTFGICAYTFDPEPNNECENALALEVYPAGGGAGHEVEGNTEFATPSAYSHTSCDDVGDNLDLFYTFTAPASGGVKIITGGAGGADIEAAVYDSCGGTELYCFGSSSEKLVRNLTPGQTYVLQIWHDSFNAAPFTIVLEEAPPAPPGDVCEDAIFIPVSTACEPVYADNTDASDSGAGDPGCANYNGADLWFKTVVPSDGNLTVETGAAPSGGISDTGLAVYTGTCDNLTELDCNDDANGLFSQINLSGLTPGDTLYIRVWSYGNNTQGEVGVCAYNPNLGTEELEASGFSFYPNPAGNVLYFRAADKVQSVQLFDMSGKLIKQAADVRKGTWDISDLEKGIYLLRVQLNGNTGTYRLIKE